MDNSKTTFHILCGICGGYKFLLSFEYKNSDLFPKCSCEISESDIGWSIPIVDKDGCIDHWKECTQEEYEIWADRHEKG